MLQASSLKDMQLTLIKNYNQNISASEDMKYIRNQHVSHNSNRTSFAILINKLCGYKEECSTNQNSNCNNCISYIVNERRALLCPSILEIQKRITTRKCLTNLWARLWFVRETESSGRQPLSPRGCCGKTCNFPRPKAEPHQDETLGEYYYKGACGARKTHPPYPLKRLWGTY